MQHRVSEMCSYVVLLRLPLAAWNEIACSTEKTFSQRRISSLNRTGPSMKQYETERSRSHCNSIICIHVEPYYCSVKATIARRYL